MVTFLTPFPRVKGHQDGRKKRRYVTADGKGYVEISPNTIGLPLSPDTLERARELAPTWDIKVLIGESRSYAAKQKEPQKKP